MRLYRVAVPTIRPATSDDLPAVGRALAAAFDDDPVWNWLRSPRADWATHAPAWFAKEAEVQLKGRGEVLVDDELRGAAIWSPPLAWKSTKKEGLALAVPSVRLFGSRVRRGIQLVDKLEKRHPNGRHWYLAILGTDPAHQGSGVGSALISTITDRCDEEGLGAYLESSKAENVPFYARHGFEVRDEVRLPSGPPMWLMWRKPKG